MPTLKDVLKPLIITGLIAGTLDGLAACIMYVISSGKDPMNVFRYIASGVFGPDAFNGGVPMALWGIAFHYFIAFGWTVLFFIVALRASMLTRNWIVSGILYGIFVWAIMNLVIVPLSLVPMKSGGREWLGMIKAALVLIVCIGLPVSYSAKRHLSRHP